MRKIVLLYIPLIIIAVSNLAAQVDREELERNVREVEFLNFQGPHDIIETRAAIMSVGTGLAAIISAGNQQATASGGRYRVLNLLDPSEPEKKGADIFIIEADARVDHIRNLRLMIAGYLSGMYGYNTEDAMFIATLVTYYNAVYRGDLDYFGGIYINKVMVNLSKENAGIDVDYRNWPGKTRLVIPLRTAASGAERPDLFALADKEVIEDLRGQEDMGIDDRKRIVELQEEAVAEDRRDVERREETVARREEQADQREAAVEQRRQDVQQQEASGQITEAQATEERRRIEEEERAIVEERRQIEEEKDATETIRREIEQREDEIAAARDSIVEDSNVLSERETDTAGEESVAERLNEVRRVTFLMLECINREGRFVFYDLAEEKILMAEDSPVVGGRLFIDSNAGYILPAKNERGSFVLMTLSKEDLSPVLSGTDEVHGQTFLLFSDNRIYCVTRQAERYVIGRYSQDLKLEATSDIDAFPDTFITASGNFIVFQKSCGMIAVVDKDTLKERS